MIYRFKSRATADLILMGPDGDRLLRALGREPAGRGIFEVDALPAAIAALEAAVAAEAAAARDAEPPPDEAEGLAEAPAAVSLRQRAWPMIEMLRRAQAEGQPVVWGV